MGLFGEIDLDEVPEDPFYVAPGTYIAHVTKASIQQPKKQGSKPGLAVQFTIDDENAGQFDGQTVSTWNTVFPDATKTDLEENPKMRKQMSYLRKYLTDLGIPAEEHETFDENLDDLIGRYYVVTVVETPDNDNPDIKYTNVQSVREYESVDANA